MQIAVEIEEGPGAVAQVADHPKSARPASTGRNGNVSADSFRALTARLRKPTDTAAPASRALGPALGALTERLAKAKSVPAAAPTLVVPPPVAEAPQPPAPPEAFSPPDDMARGIIDAINAAAPPLAPQAEPPEAARDIIATINTAMPPAPAPALAIDPEQDELEQIRAAIFAPLKPFTPPAPEPSPAEDMSASAFDPFWTPAPPSAAQDPWPVAADPVAAAERVPLYKEEDPAALQALAEEPEAVEDPAPSITVILPDDALTDHAPVESASDIPAAPDEARAEMAADAVEPYDGHAAEIVTGDTLATETVADEVEPAAVTAVADPVFAETEVLEEVTAEHAAIELAPAEEVIELAPAEPAIEPAPTEPVMELAPAESVIESAPVEPIIEPAPAESVIESVPAEPVVEAAADPVLALPEEPVAEAAPLTAPAAAPVIEEAPEFVPVPLPGEEPKTAQQTALAGKVVDAMLKTISAAVYAKPTANERAAFLREMAELMAEAAGLPAAEMDQAPAPVIVIPAVITADIPAAPVAEPAEAAPAADQPITAVLADRIGSASPILKRAPAEPDPFALAQPTPRALIERAPEETQEADEESGELALTLLDMMSGGTGSLPHERTLAADTLLRILPRIPVKQLLAVVERVAIMEAPPPLLVAKLIRDPRPEVVGPLLERCSHISDQDLMNAAASSDTAKLRMIARRRVLSTVLSDFLIATGEPAVLLTLIRNPGAAFSHEAFFRLAAAASQHNALLAPLATRNDLPPPVAFELFWHVPQELRRFIFSRFLTDSENLNRILRITLATHGNAGGDNGLSENRFPPREAVEQAVRTAADFKLDEAAATFAEMAGIARDTVLRIFADREGEPFTVLMKMLGCQRAKFEELSELLRNCDPPLLRPDRKADDLQAIFDSLSFNKARILITYWDWFVRKAGPYAEAA